MRERRLSHLRMPPVERADPHRERQIIGPLTGLEHEIFDGHLSQAENRCGLSLTPFP